MANENPTSKAAPLEHEYCNPEHQKPDTDDGAGAGIKAEDHNNIKNPSYGKSSEQGGKNGYWVHYAKSC